MPRIMSENSSSHLRGFPSPLRAVHSSTRLFVSCCCATRSLSCRTMFYAPKLPALVSALGFDALAQRIHQVDHIRSSGLSWAFDLLSFLLFAEKLLERVLVSSNFSGSKSPRFVPRKDHVLAVPTPPEQVEDQPVGSQMIVSPSIRQDRTGSLAAAVTLTASSADSVPGTPSTIYVATVRPRQKEDGKEASIGWYPLPSWLRRERKTARSELLVENLSGLSARDRCALQNKVSSFGEEARNDLASVSGVDPGGGEAFYEAVR